MENKLTAVPKIISKRFYVNKLRRISFYILDWFIPKDNYLVVFAQKTFQYSDNGKALHDYINSENCTKWRAIWLYRDDYQEFYPKTALRIYTLKAFIVALRARFFVHSHGKNSFGSLVTYSPRTKLVNVWHGIAIKELQFFDQRYRNSMPHKLAYRCNSDLHCVSSLEDMYHMSATFQLPPSKIAITGLPRTDKLFTNDVCTTSYLPKEVFANKTILYAPTHRDYDDVFANFFPFKDFDIAEVHQFLVENNAHIVFREHRHDKGLLDKLDEYCSKPDGRFHQLHPEALRDITEFLPFVDVIITDYSSIYIDLLLKNIPCIFIPYDLKDYVERRGLAYHYDDVTPGPKISTQKEFLEELKEALQGAPKYQQQRDTVKKLFFKYNDGGSCKRTLQAMQELI